MITGFNTDIEHNGTVYHVQTEDKGLDTPFILSLVYVGGAILASKRAPYDDLLGAAFDQSALGERVQRQHKLICAAINAGRIEDLKRMGQREAGQHASPAPHADRADEKEPATIRARRGTSSTDQPAAPDAPATPQVAIRETAKPEDVTQKPAARKGPADEVATDQVVADKVAADKVVAEKIVTEKIVTEKVAPAAPKAVRRAVAEPDIVTGPEAFAASFAPPAAQVCEPARAEEPQPNGALVAAAADVALTLHERIEEREAETLPVEIDDALHVELLGEKDYHAGEMVTLRVAVLRGPYGFREVVRDANVTVKVLGTEFRPLILTSKTDADGLAVVHVWLPRFKKGRAAILVRATSDDCSAELRRIIHHN